MESIGIASEPAIAPNDAALPLAVSPGVLVASFASVRDPRRRQGTRYSLAAILALAVVAILSNCTSILAIAQFGADAPLALREALSFPDGKTPRQSTFHRLFAKLNPDALIAVLSHACCQVVPAPKVRASQGVAIDGKAQRGRLAADPAAGTVHSLSAYCHAIGVVLSQAPIAHADDKAEAELTFTPDVIALVDWRNRILTGDALFDDIRLLFASGDSSVGLTDRREATTIDYGHGRYADTHNKTLTTLLSVLALLTYLSSSTTTFSTRSAWYERPS